MSHSDGLTTSGVSLLPGKALSCSQIRPLGAKLIEFWTVFWTAAVTLTGAWFTYWLVGKPRLIAFSPNSTSFQLNPTQPGSPPMAITAGQVIVQNNGRISATDVQIVAEPGIMPWGYNIVPAVDHQVRTGSRGEWILELDYLGPGENSTVQILNGPQIASVRAKEGPARAVPVVHQRLYPRWFNGVVVMLMAVGLITIGYGIYSAINALLTLSPD